MSNTTTQCHINATMGRVSYVLCPADMHRELDRVELLLWVRLMQTQTRLNADDYRLKRDRNDDLVRFNELSHSLAQAMPGHSATYWALSAAEIAEDNTDWIWSETDPEVRQHIILSRMLMDRTRAERV